ncbi:hypothetical protein PR202_gb24614 [Eleusine coracana subsp. coracana]|uniref:Uncharacterized protein n=1 Tax=Eleusine coracana subsp. coracana TaxID=191504 RepID=A0AAV5FLI5_ELECO|nr:hypothetical protein PR202_gb24614 [Eleusine coracana subsp. coracana]
MEKQEQEQEQWQGAVETRLPSTPAAAAWPHIADFFALHRYLPTMDVCKPVDGSDEVRPGCVRYCAFFAPGTEEVATWAREELVELHQALVHLEPPRPPP